ncbi:MAG TPA: sigma 54-interacting transcriptional regulator [Usitatibacter sp.]|nr:sigma 54-interacting transcriptional regulator [Usitatibacter sp.]
MSRLKDPAEIRKIARKSLFEGLDGMCEGAIIVDREARIVWLSDKYAARLKLACAAEAIGRSVEEVIPNSLMREVVRTGEPIMVDIMQFEHESFVVMRVPIKDERGRVIGGAGFMLFDRLQYLQPLVSKFQRLQTELADAQKTLAEERKVKYTFSNFIGSSSAAMEVKRQARRAAQVDTTVLLLGETGTGKEILAQAIHAASPRAHGPFVGVNVAAIPDTLLEAEFFGSSPSAYTGAARRGREGKFVLANGGTLFLDEVGDMPIATQAKLLRALQEKEVEPLGSNRVSKVDLRVIAASSVDLRHMVSMGRFRSDLYYRLSVLPIGIPTLRERISDLELLCDHILEDIARRCGRAQREITPTALAVLEAYAWPGNVRELRNVLEQVTLNSDSPRLTAEEFTLVLPRMTSPARHGDRPTLKLADIVADAERSAIRSALAAAEGKKILAAELLGISRATLYQKLSTLATGRAERRH